jgi:hypothetical protein
LFLGVFAGLFVIIVPLGVVRGVFGLFVTFRVARLFLGVDVAEGLAVPDNASDRGDNDNPSFIEDKKDIGCCGCIILSNSDIDEEYFFLGLEEPCGLDIETCGVVGAE